MRKAARRQRFRPGLGAVSLSAGISLVLAGTLAPVPLQNVAHVSYSPGGRGGAAQTIVCPSVVDRLPAVPKAARAEVQRNLALLEAQIAEANRRLVTSAGQGGPNFVRNAILGPLRAKRFATLNRIETAIGRVTVRPEGLEALAPCSLVNAGQGGGVGQGQNGGAGQGQDQGVGQGQGDGIGQGQDQGAGQGQNGGAGQGQDQGVGQGQGGGIGQDQDQGAGQGQGQGAGAGQGQGQEQGVDPEDIAAAIGPSAEDFIDIRRVPRVRQPRFFGRNASRGTFTSPCGRNEEGHFNTDNIIVAPGVPNGAQHLHDHVGNLSTDAFSTNESLAAADTTCRVRDDKTTYFWPVLRVRGPNDEPGAPEPNRNNIGTPVLPAAVLIQYRGNPVSKVTAMPNFIRLFTGDARAATNGGANARPTWTCTGFTDRLTTKYPICPRGSRLVRIFDMPSCWDGQNTDSLDHRSHIVFPDANGACPSGTRAVPQLRMTLIYNVPNTRPNGTNVPFAVDGFASERHNPITDHAGTIIVMSDRLINAVVRCINSGRRC